MYKCSSLFSSDSITPLYSFTFPDLKTRTLRRYKSLKKNTQIWRFSAANEHVAVVSKQGETVQKIVTSDEGTGASTRVIYIAVTDFLTKREREKYEKDENEKKKKKKGGKKVVRSRVGPKGFRQKLEDGDDFDDF
ncbi:hypothetical protein MKW94_016645 [Papaver nudicaule]|uniref:Uncharacterized protein n=1 Tax=Papaver nudicaule TaxID=74823 RepID=A0AA41V3P2_PAPNU|nr:hypothetical protein [Papaver nudicaule]